MMLITIMFFDSDNRIFFSLTCESDTSVIFRVNFDALICHLCIMTIWGILTVSCVLLAKVGVTNKHNPANTPPWFFLRLCIIDYHILV